MAFTAEQGALKATPGLLQPRLLTQAVMQATPSSLSFWHILLLSQHSLPPPLRGHRVGRAGQPFRFFHFHLITLFTDMVFS